MMQFYSLDQYRGRVFPERFAEIVNCTPGHWRADRLDRCKAFFVNGWTQARIARVSRCSGTLVRNNCVELLAFWALENSVFGRLREKPIMTRRQPNGL